MKQLALFFFMLPTMAFTQRRLSEPIYQMVEPSVIVQNKVLSITKRKVRKDGDSIVSDRVLEHVFFEEDGLPKRRICWDEWTNDSTLTENKDYLKRRTVSKTVEQCDYKFNPGLLKLTEITGVKCLPEEITDFIQYANVQQTIDSNEWIGLASNRNATIMGYNYYPVSDFYLVTNSSGDSTVVDSLDMRTLFRINRREKSVEYQCAYISDPPTNVTVTTYHRTVYHYNFSMQLLWKDEYRANLNNHFGRNQPEDKVSQTIYDYYENGMLRRTLTFYENAGFYYEPRNGLQSEEVIYEITYRE